MANIEHIQLQASDIGDLLRSGDDALGGIDGRRERIAGVALRIKDILAEAAELVDQMALFGAKIDRGIVGAGSAYGTASDKLQSLKEASTNPALENAHAAAAKAARIAAGQVSEGEHGVRAASESLDESRRSLSLGLTESICAAQAVIGNTELMGRAIMDVYTTSSRAKASLTEYVTQVAGEAGGA